MGRGPYTSRERAERIDEGEVRLITGLDDQTHLPEAKWLKETFPDALIGFRSNSREVQLHAALAGSGGAALARYRADFEPGLVRVFPTKPDLTRDIWLGVHMDMRHVPRVRAASGAGVEALHKSAAILNPGG